ncbi:L,D-transpeptidase family protein [Sphingomonas ginkgonis]|nr:L,D-transpeptidase family protein [Sphingomonas ginkgonis]
MRNQRAGLRPARALFRSGLLAVTLAAAPAVGHAAEPFSSAAYLAGTAGSSSAALGSDQTVAAFYNARERRPLWLAQGPGAAEQLIALLASSRLDGLDPDKFKPGSLERAVRSADSGNPRAVAKADSLLSQAFVNYVRQLRDTSQSGIVYGDPAVRPLPATPRAILEEAARAPDIAGYVQTMGWMNPLYGQLRQTALQQNVLADRGAADLVARNLQRARVLPVDRGQKYVVVDTAAARLYMFEGGRPVDSMKVVVGKPTQPTPLLASAIRNVVLNPYWNVPDDLTAERIAPRVVGEGMKYFTSKRYQVLSDWGDSPRLLDARTIDWAAVRDGRAQVRVRQLPGPDNAMGRMKFTLPNDLGIYLHDTNDPGKFDEAARNFSGGCVRLEAAPRLARFLFGKRPTPKGQAPEQKVELPAPIPVYMTYLTATAQDGTLVFRDDVYHRDGGAARLASR